ncbi:MAG: hypothetical protein HQL91_06550 [Magnetococcales bacterium]|nr:hypothetical protein [Magnetococcales bacterium]
MEDLFAAEGLILARLRTQVAAFRLVAGARELKSIPAGTGTTPALYLVADGFQPLGSAGGEQALEPLWLAVVAVRHGRQVADGAGERQEAGPLLAAVCQALIGWQPADGYAPMRLVTTPGALFTDGLALFPLRFATRLRVGGG